MDAHPTSGYSNPNRSGVTGRWQLDTYALDAPSASLYLLTWDGRLLIEELLAVTPPVDRLDRWSLLRCGDVLRALDRAMGPAAAVEDEALANAVRVATRLETS